MGSCFSSDEGGGRPSLGNRQSSLASLNDSRHVMMKRSKKKGAPKQQDGSFYRPREDILAGIPQIGEDKVATKTNTEASTGNSEEPDGST